MKNIPDFHLLAGRAGGLCLLALALLAVPSHAQTINVTSAGVGIGITTPSYSLEIGGLTATYPVALSIDPSGNATSRRAAMNLDSWQIGQDYNGSGTKDFYICNGNTLYSPFYIGTTGFVGIGTGTPSQMLHIQGGAEQIDLFGPTGNEVIDWPTAALSIRRWEDYTIMRMIQLAHSADSTYQTGSAVWNLSLVDTAANKTTSDANTALNINGPGILQLMPTGNVGIGTMTPGQKLEVNGTVKAVGYIATSHSYADDVFEPTYPLMALTDVANYIDQAKHLPGVPSITDVEANGLDLPQMEVTLLRKVEELTLHAISQERDIATLQQQNAALQAQTVALQQQTAALQALLKSTIKP